MFEELAELGKVREVAELLAADADWPCLYRTDVLQQSTVPVAAATYYEGGLGGGGLDWHCGGDSSVGGVCRWW